MISSLFASFVFVATLPEGLQSLETLIEQAAGPSSDPALQSIASERILAAAEIERNIASLANLHGITAKPTRPLSDENLKALSAKIVTRLPLEVTQRILTQLQNSDEVVQFMATRRLNEVSTKSDIPANPEELALRSIYQRDVFDSLKIVYLRSLQVRRLIVESKKKKGLNLQALQKIEQELPKMASSQLP